MLGAGDGKLAAVTGGFLGIRSGLYAVMIGLFLGALWSVGRMWRDRSFGLRMSYLLHYAESLLGQKACLDYDELKLTGAEDRHRIPLAACLSAGGYLYLLGSAAFRLGGYVL